MNCLYSIDKLIYITNKFNNTYQLSGANSHVTCVAIKNLVYLVLLQSTLSYPGLFFLRDRVLLGVLFRKNMVMASWLLVNQLQEILTKKKKRTWVSLDESVPNAWSSTAFISSTFILYCTDEHKQIS